MILALLVAVPAVVGVALTLWSRVLRPAVSATLAGAAAVATVCLTGASLALGSTVDVAWLPELGVRVQLALDGVSGPLVALTSGVGALAVLLVVAARTEPARTPRAAAVLLGCVLLVMGGALAAFSARDVLVFFLAFEVVLVPMWVLITRFGDDHDRRARIDAGRRFLLYTVVGSTLMLVGLLLLVTSTGTSNLDDLLTLAPALPPGRQLLIAVLLVVGLGVKVPVVPLHTWLPAAHTIAPTVGSMLLAAVLLKLGTYALVRLPLALVPDGFSRVAPWLALAGALGVVWGGLVCLAERDLKRLIAYSSVAHMGFVILGIASGTPAGVTAALYGNLAHGVVSALLFAVVGGLKAQWGSIDLARSWPALREVAPRRGFLLMVGLAAALGLPGLAVFWGEFLALLGAWRPAWGAVGQIPADQVLGIFRAAVVVAAIGAVLAAAYCLRVARQLWQGEPTAIATTVAEDAPPPETVGAERFVLGVLALATLVLGVLPGPLMTVVGSAVTPLLRSIP